MAALEAVRGERVAGAGNASQSIPAEQHLVAPRQHSNGVAGNASAQHRQS